MKMFLSDMENMSTAGAGVGPFNHHSAQSNTSLQSAVVVSEHSPARGVPIYEACGESSTAKLGD